MIKFYTVLFLFHLVPPKELQHKIDTVSLQNKDLDSRQQTKNKCSCKSDDIIPVNERNSALKIHQIQPRSPSVLKKKPKKDLFVQMSDKTGVVRSTIGVTDKSCSGDHKERETELLSEVKKSNGTKRMMGDSEGESAKQVPFSSEHKDMSISEIASTKSQIIDSSKTGNFEIPNNHPLNKVKKENTSPKTEDENITHARKNKNIFNRVSEIVEHDKGLKYVDLVENETTAKTEKIVTFLKENMEDKQRITDSKQEKSKTIFTARSLFSKAFKWAVDEHLYIGVRNHGSFISKLSEALTG